MLPGIHHFTQTRVKFLEILHQIRCFGGVIGTALLRTSSLFAFAAWAIAEVKCLQQLVFLMHLGSLGLFALSCKQNRLVLEQSAVMRIPAIVVETTRQLRVEEEWARFMPVVFAFGGGILFPVAR